MGKGYPEPRPGLVTPRKRSRRWVEAVIEAVIEMIAVIAAIAAIAVIAVDRDRSSFAIARTIDANQAAPCPTWLERADKASATPK